MTVVRVNESKYINMDRVTFTEPTKSGGMCVYFTVEGGHSAYVKLDPSEASLLQQFLDTHLTNSSP